MRAFRIIEGDALAVLNGLSDESVQTCVTSPPYFNLRDYGVPGQIGLEETPEEYVLNLVATFREVRRVLRDDGTLWLNLGDSYASQGGSGKQGPTGQRADRTFTLTREGGTRPPAGYKSKDLIGIPWMVAFALRSDGWYLRSDIIWHKPNPMPESVTDRPTKAHEYIFLLSKSASYYYDADAIREPFADERMGGSGTKSLRYSELSGRNGDSGLGAPPPYDGRNRRSVWTVATRPFGEAHFAVFPSDLIEPCILAGSREGDTVLDPFTGSGTSGLVALRHNRNFIGAELKPTYAEMARRRILNDAPLLNREQAA